MRIPILRLGIVPVGDNTTFRSDLKKICNALGYFLGTTVEGHSIASYPRLVELLSRSQIDAAWVPPVVAMDCNANRIAEPRVAMKRHQKTSYYSAVFVRADSPIRTLADLKQVRASWVSPDSASGYLVPLASLRARGISLSKAFSEHIFAGSHAEAARLVLDGKAEIGANFVHFAPGESRCPVSSGWIEAGIEAGFRIVAVAGPIPTDVIVMHRTLPEEHKEEFVKALHWIQERPEASLAHAIFHCEGLQPCGDAHLRGLRKLVRLIERPSAL